MASSDRDSTARRPKRITPCRCECGTRVRVRGVHAAGRVNNLVPAVTAGLVHGALEVVVVTSLAAFIFTGPLSAHLADGIGVTLFAEVVLMAVVGLLATLPATTSTVQDSSAAILGIVAASMAATGEDPFLSRRRQALLSLIQGGAEAGMGGSGEATRPNRSVPSRQS